jgi:hypothetical protein
MTPSIPTYRPAVTPSRLAWLLAVAAVSGNLYLLFGDAFAAAGDAPTLSAASACLESLRAAIPGEVNERRGL